jgi:hypothetical protein
MEDEFDGFVPEPFATPEEVEKFNIDETFNDQISEDGLYEEAEDSAEDDEKKK